MPKPFQDPARYDGSQPEPPYDTLHPPQTESERAEIIADAVAAERERCARMVPTNWCDALLTGDGVARPPLGERSIEALLRGIQDRIRKQES